MTGRQLSILANNGDIGGGEVMLLALAEAARDAGYEVAVVAPESPGECADAAEERGLGVVRIPGEGRKAYMRGLRAWAKGRTELLWCNGLVPATATALLATRRVVHLHRLPEGPQKALSRIARIGAVTTVVPSAFMAGRLGRVEVLPNWSEDPAASGVALRVVSPTKATVGFLGRLSPDKGVVELVEAIALLNESRPAQPVHLMLAGEPRFVASKGVETVEAALRSAGPWLERVGWIERDELFAQIDILAVPSIWAEPFGLVAIEAMAAGVPVVVSDAGALPEVVGEDHPFVARRGDSADLSRVIRQMLDDTAITESSIRGARERWEREFSPAAGAARFLALLSLVEGS